MLEGKIPPNSIVISERLSSEYGWTPDQIRKMRTQDIDDYILILKVKSDIDKRDARRRK